VCGMRKLMTWLLKRGIFTSQRRGPIDPKINPIPK